ncbi:MAG: tetratricopeptide repeat protein [Nitrospira sp.]|nr:tetratricopeptide repeat protein [Nitrospira sp.]
MPKIIKKKVADKKSVQENEVKGFALDALDKVKERQKQLIVAGAVAAVILASYMTFSMYSSSLKADAAAIEMKANDYHYGVVVEGVMSDEERLKKAVELYQESVDVKASLTALFNLGNTYYKLGEYDKAIEQYEAVIDKFGGNTEMVSLVYQKIASSYMRSGHKEKAFEALGKLAQVKGGIFKDTAMVLEARYLESAGDTGKSLEKYLELAAAFPDSVWSGEAATKIPKPDAETKLKVEEVAAEVEKKEEVEAKE